MSPGDEIEALISTFEQALKGQPTYAVGLVGLAEVVAKKKHPVRAYELCRQALEAAAGDPEVTVRARRLLSSLAPAYSVRMMNDARRNLAWDQALRRVIGPTTHALEIGTGAGMLALMAARAGARKVTTCERDLLLARLAREIVARNGFEDRVSVIAKPSSELVVGEDLEEPADLIFCDIFGDYFFDFRPLEALADARRRLSRPDAKVTPVAGAIRAALAHWPGFDVVGRIDQAAGFDLSPIADFAPTNVLLPIGAADLTLLSAPAEPFRFDFAALEHPREGQADFTLAADADAEVNGIVHWIRLELDAETVLEARPEPGAQFFSSPRFWPLTEPVFLRRGETITARAAHTDRNLTIWRTA